MYQAKHEVKDAECVDKDTIKALLILKATKYVNEIRTINSHPFIVHYWMNAQIHIGQHYLKLFKTLTVSIDATGKICKPVKRPLNMPCGPIFLYTVVINCEAGQFSLAQMLSECHNTDVIQFWLMTWFRSSGLVPNEVVVDMSRALLTAVIRTFTHNKTLEEYCEQCSGEQLPDIFVRIDNAHFIKKYAQLLKSLLGPSKVEVKRFYLAVIGQLIVCQSIEQAEEILKCFFTVCYSKFDGQHENGMQTLCATEKTKLRSLIKGKF